MPGKQIVPIIFQVLYLGLNYSFTLNCTNHGFTQAAKVNKLVRLLHRNLTLEEIELQHL